jgi:hypothetical protein
MKKKMELFKIEFIKGLKDSDYEFRHSYDRIEYLLHGILIDTSWGQKTKFKFFKLVGTEKILIQADNRLLVDYVIRQNGTKFEKYELLLSKWN